MSRMRQNVVTVAAAADLRDVLFTTEQDPYTADRTEIVDIWLTQDPGAAGNLQASILAGPVEFANRITPTITTGRTPLSPITSQDPAITIGLRAGERLKIPVVNTDGANAGTLFYIIQSRPAR